MSLTDLKKRKNKTPRTKMSVDEFIEDANNYAFGQPSKLALTAKKQPASKSIKSKKRTSKIYKHATFTLTESSIEHLNSLAKQTQQAKSKLIRIMIADFDKKSAEELEHILQNSQE
ncbi:replication protein RepA [Shewanella waksmanii]|uniref:replication protein RepA n=1 Tax=Shewanella waksmanii TaxID=213783 RepID=UPI0037351FED